MSMELSWLTVKYLQANNILAPACAWELPLLSPVLQHTMHAQNEQYVCWLAGPQKPLIRLQSHVKLMFSVFCVSILAASHVQTSHLYLEINHHPSETDVLNNVQHVEKQAEELTGGNIPSLNHTTTTNMTLDTWDEELKSQCRAATCVQYSTEDSHCVRGKAECGRATLTSELWDKYGCGVCQSLQGPQWKEKKWIFTAIVFTISFADCANSLIIDGPTRKSFSSRIWTLLRKQREWFIFYLTLLEATEWF